MFVFKDFVKQKLINLVKYSTRMNKKQVVNSITLLRVILLPLLYVLLVFEKRQTAALVLVLAGLTDVVDGTLARYWKVADRRGAVLDGCADYSYYVSYVVWMAWLFPSIVAANKILAGSATLMTIILVAYMYVKRGGLLFGHFLLSRVSAVCSFVMMTAFLSGFEKAWIFQVVLLVWMAANGEIWFFLRKGVKND